MSYFLDLIYLEIKYSFLLIVSTFKIEKVKAMGNFFRSHKINHLFCRHISNQFVLCHRATAYSFYGAVKTSASAVIGSFQLSIAVFISVVKMCTKSNFGV